MKAEKLRLWLSLPNGTWPPDYYQLIGLDRGSGTSEEIEARILERLELLRRQQLLFPEEATEGMNLLAKALDCLIDPEQRQTYDQSLGLVKDVPPKEPKPAVSTSSFDSIFPGIPLLPSEIERKPKEENILPDVIELPELEEELEIDEPEFVNDDEEDDEADSEPIRSAIILDEEYEDRSAMPEVIPPPLTQLKSSRKRRSRKYHARAIDKRQLYANLARIRKLLRIWDRAHPYISDFDRTFSRSTDSIALLGCLAELRPLLPTVSELIGKPNEPGQILAAMVRQPLALSMFRNLLSSQRDAFAKDFRAAHYVLSDYYRELREEVRRRNVKGFKRIYVNPTIRYLYDTPEWYLVPFGLSAILILVIRSIR